MSLSSRAARQQALEIAQQEVDVKAALVGLVDDQGVVFEQVPVMLDLGQQHAVRHQLDAGLRGDPVMEAHLVADEPTNLPAQFLRHPTRQAAGGDAPGLGVADAPEHPAAQFQTDLGQLGGLAGAGLTAQDQHLMGRDQLRDLRPALADRQLRWVGNGRHLR